MGSIPKLVPASTPNDGLPEGWQPVETPARFVGGGPQAPATAPTAGITGPGAFYGGVIPQSFQLSPDLMPTRYSGGLGGYRVMPPAPSGVAGINAAAISALQPAVDSLQSQINNIPVAVPGVGDGLIHGDPIWEIDPAYVFLRDDFAMPSQPSGSFGGSAFTSELSWNLSGVSGIIPIVWNAGAAPHIGQILMASGSSSASCMFLTPLAASIPSTAQAATWALGSVTNWKMVYVFGLGQTGQFNQGSSPPIASSFAKISCYIGLGNLPAQSSTIPAGTCPRFPNFVGLRYDTDPGLLLNLTAVATSVGGTAVYTGTITGGANNAWAGAKFIIAGFTGSNNGTFACTASTSTTLTLQNPSASAQSATATAQTPSIGDTQFVFECLTQNPGIQGNATTTTRYNIPGTTVATGITPTFGRFYRLTITSTVVGQVVMTLTDGVTSFTSPAMTIPTLTTVAGATLLAQDGVGVYAAGGLALPFGPGTILTLANINATFNGQQVVTCSGNTGISINFLSSATASSTFFAGATATGVPSYFPYVAFGTDTQASPTAQAAALAFDFWSFVWNPGVSGNGTANSLLARYF